MTRTTFVVILTALGLASPLHAGTQQADVIIYGGTSAAVIAAVQAKKMGKSVTIVSPDKHLGGLSSGGLGWTDSGKKEAIGGLSLEFYQRIKRHYDDPDAWRQQKPEDYSRYKKDESAMWVFEPHVAEHIFEHFVTEFDIPVVRDAWLDREKGVEKDGTRIVAITTLDGDRFEGKMFIDATYEGDLLATAGVSYHVGREANSIYNEQWNGIQVGVLHHSHWFDTDISPYKIPGDPGSGLLPRVSAEDPGEYGAGDHRIQAYCFRMCLTNAEENRIPFPKPEGYDPDQYELLLRVFEAGWRDHFNKFDPAPNNKTDTNNHGPFSTDNIGFNYDYPEASYERRQEIIAEHELYQKGLMYFIANDPRVPEEVRSAMAKWGLPKDEFTDNGNWSHQLYIREARRMIGHYVMTEHDCLDTVATPDSVGLGSYTLDSHNAQRYIKPDGFVQNEGDIGVHAPQPYEVAYGSIIPKAEEATNLFAPVAMSASHIAYGSIRMEPVFMILGQSAATAASIAIDKDLDVQAVDYVKDLRPRLLADGQILELVVPGILSANKLEGIVIDDKDAQLTGTWTKSSTNIPRVGGAYHHDGGAKDGKATATFTTDLPESGTYEVQLSYPPNNNRASNVPVSIHHPGGAIEVNVNQKKAPTTDEAFISLGTFTFDKTAKVVISNQGTNGYVIIDAVRFIKQP